MKYFSKRYICLFFTVLFLSNCSRQVNTKERTGLVIYQENLPSWVRNFNPLTPTGTSRWATTNAIYEPLFIFNSIKGEQVPWLATKFIWSNDNASLKIITRKNVLWSNGKKFSAKDVAFTFNIKKNFPALDVQSSWSYLKEVKALNDSIVEFKFKRIYVPGFDDIVAQAIVPEHIWDKVEDPIRFTNPNPIGTGPYTEILRFENQLWELGKNHNYWMSGKPEIEKLTFPTFPSNEQVTLSLISGELDWAGAFIPAIDRVYVSKNPDHHKYWFPQTGHTTFFYANTQKAVLKERNVRKAISYGINRELVIKIGMYDYTELPHVTGVSGKMSKWYSDDINDKENWIEYDPIKANQLLNDAGYIKSNNGYRVDKEGTELSYDIIIVSGWNDWIRSAQIISNNLKEIGIKTKVKTYDFGAWISRIQKGEFDLAISWAEKGTTPLKLYEQMMSSRHIKPIGEAAQLNYHRYSHSKADSLVQAFEKTSNPKRMKIIIQELQEIFIENVPAIPLFAEASWGECNTRFFTNFPSKENPYATLSPNYPPESLLVLVNLKNR